MFPNSLEREKLKHSLGGVLCHSVVSRGSPEVFGSDNTLPLAGFMLTRGVPAAASTGGSRPASPGRGQSPRPGHGSPPFGLQPPNCGTAARKRFPDLRHELPDNRYHKPHKPSPTPSPAKAPRRARHPRHSPGRCHLVLSQPGGTRRPDPSATLRSRNGGMETGPLHALIPAR